MDYIGYTPYIVGDDIFTLTSSWYGASDFDINGKYYAESEAMVIYNNQLYRVIQDKETSDLIDPTNEEYFESCEYEENTEYFEGDMVSYNGKIYICIYYDEANPESGTMLPITDESAFEEVEGYNLSFLFEGTLSNNRRAIIYPYYGSENQLQTQYPNEEIIARCAIMNDFGEYNENVVIMWGQVKAYTNMTPVYLFLGVFIGAVIICFIIYIVKRKVNNSFKRTN